MLLKVNYCCNFIWLNQNQTKQNKKHFKLSRASDFPNKINHTLKIHTHTISAMAFLCCMIFTGEAVLAKPSSLSSDYFLRKPFDVSLKNHVSGAVV